MQIMASIDPANRNSTSEEKQARVQSAKALRGGDAKVTKKSDFKRKYYVTVKILVKIIDDTNIDIHRHPEKE